MQNQIDIFNFNNARLTIIETYDEPYFIGKQVTELLGYKYPEIDYYRDSRQLSIRADTILIKEAGVYALAFKSKLDLAVEFTNWVAEDVIPNIRKKGVYMLQEKQKLLEDVNTTLQLQLTEKKQ